MDSNFGHALLHYKTGLQITAALLSEIHTKLDRAALKELKFERKFVYFRVTIAATELILFMYVRFNYMVS